MKTRSLPFALPRKASKGARAALIALALTSVSQAAVTITSWTYENLSTSSSLAPTGDEATVAAFDLSNGTGGTLGSVAFSAAGATATTINGITETFTSSGSLGGVFGINTVLNSARTTFPSNTGTLEYSGLTQGQQYIFQFIVADARGGTVQGRKAQIFGATLNGADVSGTSDQLTYAPASGVDSYGVISAYFTADSSGQAAFMPRIFSADGTTAQGTQVNAVHIMTVPEPSAALLGGLGLLALLRRRR